MDGRMGPKPPPTCSRQSPPSTAAKDSSPACTHRALQEQAPKPASLPLQAQARVEAPGQVAAAAHEQRNEAERYL
eukprot:scaffold1906_cov403-Prasinococcus_capsulatus_cf.AAC.10